LQASDGVKLADAAGTNEMEWHDFLQKQREILEAELAKIESSVQAAKLC
jgi:hypothetical protein